MSLSANTLIHFTKDKDVLKKILEENFKVFNCRENILLGGIAMSFHIPMVSFCDIPLSQVKEHIEKYGTYGLGMTKEWGVEKGLNPVFYISKTSNVSESYRFVYNHFFAGPNDDMGNWTEEKRAFADLLRYMKNYEATLEREGTTIQDYRFSDEREWRYVPSYTEMSDSLVLSEDYDQNKAQFDLLLKDMRLVFEPNDIKYIIINDDSEIGEFIDYLRRAKGKNYSLHDVERLTTRILTTDQIMTDV